MASGGYLRKWSPGSAVPLRKVPASTHVGPRVDSVMRFRKLGWALGLVLRSLTAQDQPSYTFGTTVVDLSGLEGRIYFLDPSTQKLPDFSHRHAVGSVYTTMLNVWPQPFSEGFPNITDRFEWFGIEYTGKFWVEIPGQYRFSLLSDDGAKLRIDGKLVINNDGVHAAFAASAAATLTRGSHSIRVDYFQGPRFTVALVLAIARPGEAWRIFDTRDFKPPNDPAELRPGKISDIKPQTAVTAK